MSYQRYYAHGKLMLTGEYAVLDGAKALAFPTIFGQTLEVAELEKVPFQIAWQSYDYQGSMWLNAQLPSNDYSLPEYLRLQEILRALEALNPEAFYEQNLSFTTHLEFPRDWGLGSSSTLISLLAQWANVDAYELLEKTFGGSGYDIACAASEGPLVYQNLRKNKVVETVELSEEWTKGAYFIFLNEKKNSREAIKHYRSLSNTQEIVEEVSRLTQALCAASNISDAISLVQAHEHLMSLTLQLDTVQSQRFKDFDGVCKSLGAWGGDFIMALTTNEEEYVRNYFESKGFNTIFTFDKIRWK